MIVPKRLGHVVFRESIYFSDPDGNIIEFYGERPDAREIFARGRGDQDAPLVFTRGCGAAQSRANVVETSLIERRSIRRVLPAVAPLPRRR
jgi:hypothetical protein